MSVPLQALCLAIFDAINVHIMNQVAPLSWQKVRKELCDVFIHEKEERAVEVVKAYESVDVMFLTKASFKFALMLAQNLKNCEVHTKSVAASENAIILTNRNTFCRVIDITSNFSDELLEYGSGRNFLYSALKHEHRCGGGVVGVEAVVSSVIVNLP